MICELYKKKDINGTHYMLVRDRPLVSNLSAYVANAILLLLDTEQFRTEELINLEDFVREIEEKKSAGVLSMPTDFYTDNERDIGPYAFFRACNILEFIFGFSQGLGTAFSLEGFAIKFC